MRVSEVTVVGGRILVNPPTSLTAATSGGVDLTSLTVSVDPTATADQASVVIDELAPAAGQSTCSASPNKLGVVYQVSVHESAPFSVAFPTPLQIHGPAALGSLCLGVEVTGGAPVLIDASGYYGT